MIQETEGNIKSAGEITPPKLLKVGAPFKEMVPYFALGTVILTLFLLLVLGGWYLATKNTLRNVEKEIEIVDTELVQLKKLEEEAMAFSGAVRNIENALALKNKWSPLFKELEAITPKDVVYTSFAADEGGVVQISGYGSSFTSLAKMLVAFSASKFFHNPVLTSVSISDNKAHFSMSVSIPASALRGRSVKEGK